MPYKVYLHPRFPYRQRRRGGIIVSHNPRVVEEVSEELRKDEWIVVEEVAERVSRKKSAARKRSVRTTSSKAEAFSAKPEYKDREES